MLRLWHHLSRRRRRQFVLLVGLILLGAIAEIVSLGAVLPFLGMLLAPERVFKYPVVADFARTLGIVSPDHLLLPVTIVFAAAALIAGAIRLLLLWASTRLAFATGADFSIDVYRRTLYQPYWVHVARNSSDVISGITNKVGDTVVAFNQMLTLISSIVLLVAITLTLFAIDPMVAIVGDRRIWRQLRTDYLDVSTAVAPQQPAHRTRTDPNGQSATGGVERLFAMCCWMEPSRCTATFTVARTIR